MSELLIELFSEEIPARMQTTASADLLRLVTDGLEAQGLGIGEAEAFATPRRLTLVVRDVADGSAAVSQERKGPRVGAPDKAIEGFLRGAGLSSIDEAEIISDPKKGDFYVARTEKAGRSAGAIIADVVPEVIRKFPWPKSMEWGEGGLRWVRPLHRIVCLLDGAVVPFEIAGIASGAVTGGHRFMGKADVTVKGFADYVKKLKANKVILDPEERVDLIRTQVKALAKKAKLEWVEDEALVRENAGLNEWPTVLIGTFDEDFLSVPPEVLTTSMKSHQKCFSLRDGKTGALANKFLLVTNLEAKDGGKAIVAGNERVIRARLADAKFFWEKDLATPLDEMANKLDRVTFHENLGTQKDRVERIQELAFEIAKTLEVDHDHARRAAQICKADLVSEMVGEFTELQGVIGRYYEEAAGGAPEIARAIELHYKPKGPGDTVPSLEHDGVAVAVALADKLDTLVGFWAIDEKPTGSGDPYALRRAALGVVRICVENDLRLSIPTVVEAWVRPAIIWAQPEKSYASLAPSIDPQYDQFDEPDWAAPLYMSFVDYDGFASEHKGDICYAQMGQPGDDPYDEPKAYRMRQEYLSELERRLESLDLIVASSHFDALEMIDGELVKAAVQPKSEPELVGGITSSISHDLLSFFADRLKVYLRDQGQRHDLIDAIFSLGGQDDLALIVRRVEALGEFLEMDDGVNLLAGVKRAANILTIEEKKDKTSHAGEADEKLLEATEEKTLHKAIEKVSTDVTKALDVEKFGGAMRALAELRAPVDAFFDNVIVNADNAAVRGNRLKLLSQIRAATEKVADFSKIEG